MSIFRRKRSEEQRYSFADWASEFFTFGGMSYGLMPAQTLTGTTELPDKNFVGLVTSAYQSNATVFACCLLRQMLFSEARFQFQQIRKGRPGDLFGTTDLTRLETPWPGGTTGDLLSRMIQDADMAGNAFVALDGPYLFRLRPDWVTIVMGSRTNSDAELWDRGTEVLGYVYEPGGPAAGRDPVTYTADQVAHFAPIPDPLSPHRGMSWMQSILTEIAADTAATAHKRKFFDNGATVNQAIVLDPSVQLDMFQRLKEVFEKEHQGVANAYKTLFLGGGADIKTLGADFQQADFANTQGKGETRIAAAAGVHPTIVGLSEGLSGSSLNAGNFGAARRLAADRTLRPLWRNAAGSLATIVNVPQGSRLWIDERDIAFLREDEKDAAAIQQTNATTITQLINGGFDPDSVVLAVDAGDLTLLKHTGLLSVQLQPPGTVATPPAPPASTNGNGPTNELVSPAPPA